MTKNQIVGDFIPTFYSGYKPTYYLCTGEENITDIFANNLKIILPILRRHRISAINPYLEIATDKSFPLHSFTLSTILALMNTYNGEQLKEITSFSQFCDDFLQTIDDKNYYLDYDDDDYDDDYYGEDKVKTPFWSSRSDAFYTLLYMFYLYQSSTFYDNYWRCLHVSKINSNGPARYMRNLLNNKDLLVTKTLDSFLNYTDKINEFYHEKENKCTF